MESQILILESAVHLTVVIFVALRIVPRDQMENQSAVILVSPMTKFVVLKVEKLHAR